MGYRISTQSLNKVFKHWLDEYDIYAPKRYPGDGAFSDTDLIRYGTVQSVDEIEFAELSDFSFKKVLLLSMSTQKQFSKAVLHPIKTNLIFSLSLW